MTTYTVTAVNKFFYMDLAIDADNVEQAETAFRAYLDATRSEEDYEYDQGGKLGLDQIEHAREDYTYNFDADDLEEGEPRGRFIGTIGREVVMTGSGGNG